jgi:hypothetical protein
MYFKDGLSNGIFVLKKKIMVDQNGRSACISNIFAQRITKMDENF